MKNRTLFLIALFLSLGFNSCKKKDTANKIISGLPTNVTQEIRPAQAIQHVLLLKRDLLKVVIPVINKVSIPDSDFSELTMMGSSYTFVMQNSRYGLAMVTLQFLDSSDMVLGGPQSSSSTFKTLSITLSNTSSLFTINENLLISLDIPGDTASTKRMTGTSLVNGSGITNMTFTFPISQQAVCVYEGLTQGIILGSGSNTNGPTSATLSIATDHTVGGTLFWDNSQGAIQLRDNGTGILVTDSSRYLIN